MEQLTQCSKKLEKLENKLTVKERFFCKHYLVNDFVGKDAAIEAGFSEKSAKCIAHQLLKKPRIKKYIAQCLRAAEKKLDIELKDKIELLWKAANRCIGPTDEEVERLKKGEPVKVVFGFDPNALINTIAEMNKMQGHYAAPKMPNDAAGDLDKQSEEIKKHEREC